MRVLMPVLRAMFDPAVRRHLGRELAACDEAESSPMPLLLIELMARIAVAEAMMEFNRAHQRPLW